jgi:hypothetical protein
MRLVDDDHWVVRRERGVPHRRVERRIRNLLRRTYRREKQENKGEKNRDSHFDLLDVRSAGRDMVHRRAVDSMRVCSTVRYLDRT